MSVREGTRPTHYWSVDGDRLQSVSADVVAEEIACLFVNGHEIASWMCSPHDLELLALGFLANEGIIEHDEEVAHLHISENHCVDVWLHKPMPLLGRPIVTAGCGGGVTFDDFARQRAPFSDDGREVRPKQLAELMRQLHLGATLYQSARGIHTAALADEQAILYQTEDLGRHNCLDKLRGAVLRQPSLARGTILLTSGRISSEMIKKAHHLGAPLVCSRTSPTSQSIALAQAWNMTVVGYLRQDKMRIYTHPQRIVGYHGQELP